MHELFLLLEQLQLCFNAKTDNMNTVQTVHIGRQPCRPDRQTDRHMHEKMLSSLRLSGENICPEVLKPVVLLKMQTWSGALLLSTSCHSDTELKKNPAGRG